MEWKTEKVTASTQCHTCFYNYDCTACKKDMKKYARKLHKLKKRVKKEKRRITR